MVAIPGMKMKHCSKKVTRGDPVYTLRHILYVNRMLLYQISISEKFKQVSGKPSTTVASGD